MQLEHPANIEMCYLKGFKGLGCETPAKLSKGALDRNATVQPLIFSFIYDPHAAFTREPENTETVQDKLTGGEWPLNSVFRKNRRHQEAFELGFPLHPRQDFRQQFGIASTNS